MSLSHRTRSIVAAVWTRRPVAIVAVTSLVAAGLGTSVLIASHGTAASADEVTVSQDNLRTGWDPNEPGLGPVSDGGPVGGPTFGQLFETQLNGQIYAQPVVAGQTVIVATETNHVYGLNAVTGSIEWSDFLGAAEPSTATGCPDLTPNVGITSAPVYDPSTGTVYLVAVVNDGPAVGQPHVYTYAIDAHSGTIKPGWPVAIQGSPANQPGVSFDPLSERQRAGLLLLNGWLYLGFGSYCDFQPYAGYVAGVNTSTRAETLWTDESGLTDSMAGIWQGGGGIMSDKSGRIFVSTGNGVSPPPGPGANPPAELGDSVVQLNVGSDGSLSAADFFSPIDAPTLDVNDEDFGSGGFVGLPFGSAINPDVGVQAGKDGHVYLLNRDDLGGREQGSGGTDGALQVIGPYGGQFGHPAAFGPAATVSAATSNDYVYYSGKGDYMRYLQFGVDGSGAAQLSDVANTSTKFGFGSGSPAVTSNGNDPASAVVWEVFSSNATGAGGSLQAFPGVPSANCAQPCTISPIWSAPIGTAAKFTVPATDNGRVYVGTRDGTLFGFGSPDAAPLGGSAVNFGKLPVGRSRTATATLTVTNAVTVRSIGTPGAPRRKPFRTGTIKVNGSPVTSFPLSLSPGNKITVPITFVPAHAGGVTSALHVATTAANFPSVSVSLTGIGTKPGLTAAPTGLNFGKLPDLTTDTQSVQVTNWSNKREVIAATSRPGSPFRAKLPAAGKALAPGQSVPVEVTYRPTARLTSSSSFSITTSGGHVLRVRLTGTGTEAVSRLQASTASVNFGPVPLGTRVTQSVVVRNTGNLPAVVTSIAGSGVPFGLQAPVPNALPLNPTYKVTVPVSFTPTTTGVASGSFTVRWRDGAGKHSLRVFMTGNGVGAASGRQAVPPPGGGWTLNGKAHMSGQKLALTAGHRRQAGSAVYSMPEPSNGLQATFTTSMTGAGGMTLSLLKPADSSSSSLGRSGRQLGFGGLSGVAVTLGTARFPGTPSRNFAGIATSRRGHGLTYVRTTSSIPKLRNGQHKVSVAVSGRKITLSIDGKNVLSATVPTGAMPRHALVSVTGSTGSTAGSQTVSGVLVSADGRALPPPGGGWSFNAAAGMSRSAALLTGARRSAAGSVVYPVAVPTTGLKVTFSAQLYGGSGGQGLSFALLNPATASATSVGGDGAGYGVAGVDGLAIVLNTVAGKNEFYPPNSVAVDTSTSGSTSLQAIVVANAVGELRPGPSTVTVLITPANGGNLLTVWLNGAKIVNKLLPNGALTSNALLAFTGATGTRTDVHKVRDVAISIVG